MDRRTFLAAGTYALGSLASPASAAPAPRPRRAPFRLAYAPHFGMFRHHAGDDLEAQLEFMAEQGFTALEDNGMRRRPVAEQERIAKTMERLGMAMGVFVAHADFGKVTFASPDRAMTDAILADIRDSLEVAKRVRARWCTVVPGRRDERTEPDWQTGLVIDNLRRCAELCEAAGLTMVLEPLNPWRDHPGLFLTKASQAWLLCRGVQSPSCKILFDVYHQQITEGNLLPNIDRAWDEIAYFQVGDHPGRCEPGTGEIHYANLFRHLADKGFTGVVGMEHGNSRQGKDGEAAVLAAYRACDPR